MTVGGVANTGLGSNKIYLGGGTLRAGASFSFPTLNTFAPDGDQHDRLPGIHVHVYPSPNRLRLADRKRVGFGSVVFSGTNSYTGDTTVSTGKLSLTHACLADSYNVYIASGTSLNLNNSGATDTIHSLYLNGVEQPAGTYDATSSPSYIAGSGHLLVTVGVPEPGGAGPAGGGPARPSLLRLAEAEASNVVRTRRVG